MNLPHLPRTKIIMSGNGSLSHDISDSEMTTSRSGKNDPYSVTIKSDFPTKNNGPSAFGRVFLLHRQIWQVLAYLQKASILKVYPFHIKYQKRIKINSIMCEVHGSDFTLREKKSMLKAGIILLLLLTILPMSLLFSPFAPSTLKQES